LNLRPARARPGAHRGCGEKWRRGGVWRAVPGRRVRRMLQRCFDSPLLPTDHRDSPRTL